MANQRAWSSRGGSSPAQTAFDKSVELVQSDGSSLAKSWLSNKYTIVDVEEEVEKAKNKYDNKPKSRARRWLGEVSLGVAHYANILDVMAQHHPEYVSLAWGTTKFLFVLFQNREELLAQLSKSFVRLNGLLPRMQIQANLYDDPQMRRHVEALYAEIIRYYHEMLRFYEEGRAMRIWTSFIKPFSLRFADVAERVSARSRDISELAAALSQQQQQETQALLQQTYSVLLEVRKELAAQKTLVVNHMSITEDMRKSGMIEAVKTTIFEEPGDVLIVRMSFCKRQYSRQNIDIRPVWSCGSLKSWCDSSDSAALVVQGSLSKKAECLAIGTYMAAFVQSEQIPVLWALQNSPTHEQVQTTPAQVVKYLTGQALRLSFGGVNPQVSQALNQTRISSASTVEHWAALLSLALANVPIAYVVIDLDLVESDDTTATAQSFFESLSELTKICKPTVLKIALVNKRRTAQIDLRGISPAVINLEKILQSRRGSPRKQYTPHRAGHGTRKRLFSLPTAVNKPS